jgi:cytochrome c oxidase assembly protein subunit 15
MTEFLVSPHSYASPSPRPVFFWLLCVAALVFIMVLVGGATRLTDSGLSITEWKPVTGAIPPLSEADWLSELEKYRQIPEYQQINKGMSLQEFQFIYWWEWGHRFLGRLIGLAFVVPLVFFFVRGTLGRKDMPKMIFLLALGGLQGCIGWWMVASGLVERVDVSQYRLGVHLTLAAVIFSALIWVALDYKTSFHQHHPAQAEAPAEAQYFGVFMLFWAWTLLQIFSGALVAGLDAGLTYTTWPLMDGAFIPAASKLFVIDPWWLNLGDNPLTVQFIHRMNAYALWIGLSLFCLSVWLKSAPSSIRMMALLLLALVSLQALIGIVTLLMQVPLSLALVHQAGAFVILGAVTVFLKRARTQVQASTNDGQQDISPA